MLLAIDAGNTNTVFAVMDDEGHVRGEWRTATNAGRTADDYWVWLIQLMHLQSMRREEVTAAIIGTVVPATMFALKTLCRSHFACEPMVVGEGRLDLGIKVLVEQPSEVGADRLANAVGAHETYGGPLIVLDFGTATTFDVIDGDGNYRGGAIAPGINLSLEALHMAAAKLPRVAIGRPTWAIGTSTVSAMQSGIYWGYVAMIEGMVARIQDEFGAPMLVVATGGLATLFDGATKAIQHVDSELTLRGLHAIWRKNVR